MVPVPVTTSKAPSTRRHLAGYPLPCVHRSSERPSKSTTASDGGATLYGAPGCTTTDFGRSCECCGQSLSVLWARSGRLQDAVTTQAMMNLMVGTRRRAQVISVRAGPSDAARAIYGRYHGLAVRVGISWTLMRRH